MAETWPDRSVEYEYPASTEPNTRRWQAGIDAALADGTLQLSKKGRGLYDLHGACPRCGHDMSVEIEFDVGMGIDVQPSGRYNVDCNCDGSHDDEDDERDGCGWGGPLIVTIAKP
ncbi:hypothetical protein [Blastococcus mobilis]|uniref:Uncharacterized protein n=1 Tax=Blastococcus mobilis TaxID=1938746 RepID=A0A238Y8A6_9ACTN|nr:hypothetical protein [Blastococcus mobilis]SNR66834.1 hypothetical protein SAMN06272737_11844 [Blastococcus mobilis]